MNSIKSLPVRISAALLLALGLLGQGCTVAPDSDEAGEDGVARQAFSTSAAIGSGVGAGFCLDVSSGRAVSGTNVQLWTCNNTPAQSWTYTAAHELRSNLAPTLCLDVAGAGTANGTNVRIWTCNNTPAQKWVFSPTGELRSMLTSNLCLDVTGGSAVAGTNVQVYGCNGTPAQMWGFRRSDNDRSRCEASMSCEPDVQVSGPVPHTNCVYGKHAGLNWGSGSSIYYDEIDRCAFLHDNGCWDVNHATWVTETNSMCSQSVNFIACVERVTPATIEEANAKRCIMESALRVGADLCEPFVPRGSYYPIYAGDEDDNPTPVCNDGRQL